MSKYQFGKDFIYNDTVKSLKNDEENGDWDTSNYYVDWLTKQLRKDGINESTTCLGPDLLWKLKHGHDNDYNDIQSKIAKGKIKKLLALNTDYEDSGHTTLMELDVTNKTIIFYNSFEDEFPNNLYTNDMNNFKKWAENAGLSNVKIRINKGTPHQCNDYICVFTCLGFMTELAYGRSIKNVNEKYTLKLKKDLLENITNDVNHVVLFRYEQKELNKEQPDNVKKWYFFMRHKKGKITYEEENGKKLIKAMPKEKRELLKETVKRNETLEKKIEKSKPKASKNILKDIGHRMSTRSSGVKDFVALY